MIILNLGCGTKTCDRDDVISIDWSMYLRIKRSRVLSALAPFALNEGRLQKLRSLPNNIQAHDLRRGIPFPSDSVDAIYHSHMLEHLDKDVAERFLIEALRVLKPGGVHRIVVPDLEAICQAYSQHIKACEADASRISHHDPYVSELIEQCVRREAHTTTTQKGLRRFIEQVMLGDARRRGETHQWMYDRFNLRAKLMAAGYRQITLQTFDSSLIENWAGYGLDTTAEGGQYKPNSLYMEARK